MTLSPTNQPLASALIFFVATAVGLAMQTERIFAIAGVNPNLVLSALVVAVVYFHSFKNKYGFLAFILVLLLLVGFFWTPFWLDRLLILGLMSIFFCWLVEKMSGNEFVDASVLVISGTFIFYFLSIFFGGEPDWMLVFQESVYNVIITISIILFIQRL